MRHVLIQIQVYPNLTVSSVYDSYTVVLHKHSEYGCLLLQSYADDSYTQELRYVPVAWFDSWSIHTT